MPSEVQSKGPVRWMQGGARWPWSSQALCMSTCKAGKHDPSWASIVKVTAGLRSLQALGGPYVWVDFRGHEPSLTMCPHILCS